MQEIGIIEIVSFDQVPELNKKEVMLGLHTLEDFYRTYEGFIEISYCLIPPHKWTLLLKWASHKAEKEASANMMKSEHTLPFKKIVNPKTVHKAIYPLMNLR